MLSLKRGLNGDSRSDSTHSKRQRLFNDPNFELSPGLWETDHGFCFDAALSEGSNQATPGLSIEPTTGNSCTLLPNTPGPGDEVCYGMVNQVYLSVRNEQRLSHDSFAA